MSSVKKYRDSLLSVLCVTSWFVLVTRILISPNNEWEVTDILLAYFITTGLAVTGAIVLIFARLLGKVWLKRSFIYNLFGTLNFVIGCVGLVLSPSLSVSLSPSPYTITACLAIGIVMYKDIYHPQSKSTVKRDF